MDINVQSNSSGAFLDTVLLFSCVESGGTADLVIATIYDISEKSKRANDFKGSKDGCNMATFTNNSMYE